MCFVSNRIGTIPYHSKQRNLSPIAQGYFTSQFSWTKIMNFSARVVAITACLASSGVSAFTTPVHPRTKVRIYCCYCCCCTNMHPKWTQSNTMPEWRIEMKHARTHACLPACILFVVLGTYSFAPFSLCFSFVSIQSLSWKNKHGFLKMRCFPSSLRRCTEFVVKTSIIN